MDNVTVLFPGGFKPITGAHMQLAQRYAESPQVKRVIMLIGPKERDGVTRDKSAQIFNLLNQNPKIELQPTDFNSPIMAAYEFLFELPQDMQGTYALAASNKDNDYVRVKDFVGNVEKYKLTGDRKGRKIAPGIQPIELMVDIDPITLANGNPISASGVRASLESYEIFKQFYPQYPEEIVKNIYQVLTGTNESVFSKEWWASQLSEDVTEVTEGYMDPKTAKKHKAKIAKLRRFLDSNTGREFVYDFGDHEKTILGVKLRESLTEQTEYKEHMFHEHNPLIDRIAAAFGEDVETDMGANGRLGHGAFGTAYALKGGKVLKITALTNEANTVERLRKRAAHPHIVGYYDVRKLGDSKFYAIILDYVNTLSLDEKQWYFKLDRLGFKEPTRPTSYIIDQLKLDGALDENGEATNSFGAFALMLLKQRDSFLKAIKKHSLYSNEAHGSNVGFDAYGRLTHFDPMTPYINTKPWTSGYNDHRSNIKPIKFIQESVEKVIVEGGLGGHMPHPFESHGLTFNDMREIVSRALEGRLDMEQAVTEKTDGQNIFVTWKDGQIKFARNKGERVNPLTVTELQEKFGGRGAVSDAFGEAGEDLAEAFSKISAEQLNEIFKNGRIFANMEIIYPATRNVVAYEDAFLQFHNLTEFNEKGDAVMTDMPGGAQLQRIIQDANASLQRTFKIIPPQRLKLGRVDNFEDYQDALYNEIDQLRDKFSLQDTDVVAAYHRAWWRDVIETKAREVGYNIPEDLLETIVNRWAFADKEINITKIKKAIENPEFLEWVQNTDKDSVLKKIQKTNIQPFETIFLKLGAIVLKNASDFLALNPNKAVQQTRKDLADAIKMLRQTNDIKQLDALKTHLGKIERIGGFDTIVPVEGLVFVYGGNTYKLTGSFAPINQILGFLKYAR